MGEQQEILALLQSSDPDDIREGAYLAGQARMEEAVPLLARGISTDNIGVQEACERALGKIGGVKVLDAMLPLLRSDDSPVRNISMDLLRRVGESDVQTLCDLLQDDDPDMRIFISDILGSTRSRTAAKALAQSLLRDPEVNVRYQAAVSLGQLAFPDVEDSLIKAMNDDEWVQFAVIDALAKIRSESSVEALCKALNTSSDLVASMIVEALGVMGNVKAVPLLVRHLDRSPIPLSNKIIKAIVSILRGPSISLLGRKEGERLRGYMMNALQDEDVEVQDAAISGLAFLGGSDAFAAILGIALKLDPDQDQERLLSIINVLSGFGYDPTLEQTLLSGDDAKALTAVAIMSCINDPCVVDIFKKHFSKMSRDVQRGIIIDLAIKCGPEDLPFFLSVLDKADDGSIIKTALSFLGQKGDPRLSAPKVIAAMGHNYQDVKETALEAAIALHLPELNDHFREMFKSSDLLTRMMAVYGMGHYSAVDNEDLLSLALVDPEPDVRKLGIEALGEVCPIPQGLISKIQPCLYDETREVRLAAIDALGNCSYEYLEQFMKDAVKDSDPWIRGRCADLIGQHPSQERAEILIGMMHDENQMVVIKAVEAMVNVGGEVAFRSLLALVDHPEPEVQRVVEDAIARIREEAGE